MENVSSKFILNFTPTGMVPTKQMTEYVPVYVDEIVEECLEMAELGANMLHLHARDEDQKPTYKKEVYAEIISGIRKFNKDILICVSTSGRDFPEFEKRSSCLELKGEVKPDFGSLTLSSLNFHNQASLNSPEMIQSLAKRMMENNIRPELEVFDLGMINYAKYLEKKGLIKPPFYFNLILGNIASAQLEMATIGLMLKELPSNSIWSLGGLGSNQLAANTVGLALNGGVRVGIEDNIYLDREKTKKATNRMLVERILSIARLQDKTPYSHREARNLLT